MFLMKVKKKCNLPNEQFFHSFKTFYVFAIFLENIIHNINSLGQIQLFSKQLYINKDKIRCYKKLNEYY